jgi:hypothetical protein
VEPAQRAPGMPLALRQQHVFRPAGGPKRLCDPGDPGHPPKPAQHRPGPRPGPLQIVHQGIRPRDERPGDRQQPIPERHPQFICGAGNLPGEGYFWAREEAGCVPFCVLCGDHWPCVLDRWTPEGADHPGPRRGQLDPGCLRGHPKADQPLRSEIDKVQPAGSNPVAPGLPLILADLDSRATAALPAHAQPLLAAARLAPSPANRTNCQ